MNRLTTTIVCLVILLAAAGVTVAIFLTEPTAKRETATKETAMLVEVAEVRRGDFTPTIVVLGTVEPARDIVLSPRVSGQIVDISPSFAPGGLVDQGELLVRIDPADYQNALARAKSELHQTQADLAIEKGQQQVAQQDYQFIDRELPPEQRDLVLRQPQLNAARARLEAAQSAVAQAELELQRTEIRAPFPAHILSREANLGSQVAPGDRLGRLVGRDVYWVETAVPLSKLRWIEIPRQAGQKGSPARLRNRAAWPESVYRAGYVFQLVGSLDQDTRMATVLIEVPDPLAEDARPESSPRLMIGTYLEVSIEGKKIKGVVKLNRDHLRAGDTVWVMEDGKLSIRKADIAFRDADAAYVTTGLEDGDQVVTTNLATPTEGAALRTKGSSEARPPQDEQAPAASS